MASSARASMLKVFTGDPAQAATFLSRLQARISAKGPRFKRVLMGLGKYSGMKYDEAASSDSEEDEDSDLSVPPLEPKTPTIVKQEDKSIGDGTGKASQGEDSTLEAKSKDVISPERVIIPKSKRDRRKALRRRIKSQIKFNKCSVWIYNEILSHCSNRVLKRLSNSNVMEGDGPGLYDALKGIYITGSNINLLPMLRRFLFIKQVGHLKTLDSYVYEFNSLVSIFEEKKVMIDDLIKNSVFLEGLDPRFTKIKDDVYDEALHTKHKIVDLVERIENYAERKGFRGTPFPDRPKPKTSPNALLAPGGGSQRGRDPRRKPGESSMEYDPKKVYACYNCKGRHVGGEQACKEPCRICKSSDHVRYNCPLKKARKGSRAAKLVIEDTKEVLGIMDCGFLISAEEAKPKIQPFSSGREISMGGECEDGDTCTPVPPFSSNLNPYPQDDMELLPGSYYKGSQSLKPQRLKLTKCEYAENGLFSTENLP